jgi:prepilin-type processing-associated H-X9-DG protein
MLTCPSADGRRPADRFQCAATGYLLDETSVNGGLLAWAGTMDYIFNDGVTGYQAQSKYASRCYNGHLSRVPRQSEVCLMTDGLAGTDLSGGKGYSDLAWRPSLTSTGPVTLADAFDNTGKALDKSSFDLKRHKGMMNVAFVDGHVATVHINSGDLSKVYLLP